MAIGKTKAASTMLIQLRFISAKDFVCKAFRALRKVVFLFSPFIEVGIILRSFDLQKLLRRVGSTAFSAGSPLETSMTAHHLLSENKSAVARDVS